MSLVYIAEKDEQICEIECFALKNAGHEVESFRRAGEMLAKFKEREPDLVLLAVNLPDADGLHVVKKIREKNTRNYIPIFLVSEKGTEADIVRGLDAGADDYLPKPFGLMELISRAKALLRRHAEEIDVPVDFEHICIDKEKREVLVDGVRCELTNKEFELLYVLMRNRGKVMSRDSLMERIWGIDYEGESRTLDMHIRSLRKKIGEEKKYITTIRGVGYRYE